MSTSAPSSPTRAFPEVSFVTPANGKFIVATASPIRKIIDGVEYVTYIHDSPIVPAAPIKRRRLDRPAHRIINHPINNLRSLE